MSSFTSENIHIIVVDDDVSILRILKQFLEDKGYDVSTAGDGKKAIELIKKRGFDLVITDLMMPEIDGLGVLRGAKEINLRTQVIIITGFATIESAVEALKLGAFDYVRKPFKLVELDGVIRKAIEKIRLIKSDELLLRHLREINQWLKETQIESALAMEKDIEALEFVGRDVDLKIQRAEILRDFGLVGTGNNVLFHTENSKGKKAVVSSEMEQLIQMYEKGILTKEELELCKKKLTKTH